LGQPIGSEQEDIVEAEGYGGPRGAFMAGASRNVTSWLGVGALGLFGGRSASYGPPDNLDGTENARVTVVGESPNYKEHFFAVGAQLPLTLRLRDSAVVVEFSLVPWGGLGGGRVWLRDVGPFRVGPAYGGYLSLLLTSRAGDARARTLRWRAGLALGGYTAPAEPPGAAGGDGDFGMLHVSLIGGFDVG
jgi:hypothetical protein